MVDTIRKLIAILLMLSGVSIAISVSVNVQINTPPVPPESLGWAGPDGVEAAADVVAEMPEFRIVGQVEDNSRKNVRLWDFTKSINGGEHLPNYPQQVGDCVSFGVKNAVEYLQARQLSESIDWSVMEVDSTRGPPKMFRPIYPPYIYGYSRAIVGKGRLRGRDGSVGAWAAKGAQEGGVLASDETGVPQYSASIARTWGDQGPPERFIEIARQNPVRTVSPVRTADDVRDAICNGYPCTIASDFGTKTIKEKDGRMVARWDGRWMHQMSVIAYDGTASEPYFYILNSWGPRAHPNPLQDEPPGGFWVTEKTMDSIVRQGDSFAFSDMEGFPANEIDFNVIGQQAITQEPQGMTTMFEMPAPDVLLFVLAALFCGAAAFVWPMKRCHRHNCGLTGIVALLALLVASTVFAGPFSIMGEDEPACSFPIMGEDSPVAVTAVGDTRFPIMGETVSVVSPPVQTAWMVTIDKELVNADQLIKDHYRRNWTYPGSITSHLYDHGIKPNEISGVSKDKLERLHAAIHEVGLKEEKVTVRNDSQNCPGGVCPNPRYQPVRLFRRR